MAVRGLSPQVRGGRCLSNATRAASRCRYGPFGVLRMRETSADFYAMRRGHVTSPWSFREIGRVLSKEVRQFFCRPRTEMFAEKGSSDSSPQSFFAGSEDKLAIASLTLVFGSALIALIHSSTHSIATTRIFGNWSMSSAKNLAKTAPKPHYLSAVLTVPGMIKPRVSNHHRYDFVSVRFVMQPLDYRVNVPVGRSFVEDHFASVTDNESRVICDEDMFAGIEIEFDCVTDTGRIVNIRAWCQVLGASKQMMPVVAV